MNELREQTGISLEQAKAVETKVLENCLDYEKKIQKYKQVLVDELLQTGGTLDQKVCNRLKDLQKVLRIDNETISVIYTSLGNDLSRQGNVEGAVNLFKEAISINSKNSSAHMGLGLIFYKQGKLKDAIKKLTLARDLFKEQEMTQEFKQIEQFILQTKQNSSLLGRLKKWFLRR